MLLTHQVKGVYDALKCKQSILTTEKGTDMGVTHEEKLKKALEYLGKKHCLSKDSTLRYKRGPSVLNNMK